MFYQLYDVEEALELLDEGLKEIDQTDGTWRYETVNHILSKRCAPLFCDDGWVIVELMNDGQLFFIVAAYGFGEVFLERMAELEELAKNSGCTSIGFNTTRRGFERKLKDTGFKPVSTEYRKTLDGDQNTET